MWKDIAQLTKMKLVYFVIISGLAGYALGKPVDSQLDVLHLLAYIVGLLAITMGSFALNQVQEVKLDRAMPRTASRPIADNRMSKKQGAVIAVFLIFLGAACLRYNGVVPAFLGLATVLMYNGLYTLIWKPKWVFGAVPGAIPGAMPVVIGYSAVHPDVLTTECFYAFLVMFLWQMPHFWALAIKFKDDYRNGGIPVLPSALGDDKTLTHIGLYTICYICLAFLSPLFVPVAYYMYWVLVIPFALMVGIEFYKYFKSNGQKNWLGFFLWTNFSMLVFLLAPVGDKWLYLWMKT